MSLNPVTDLTLSVTMLSDWHVGAGAGRGEIDRIVQRDTDDLPYIPAKTLTGILRDGCEQVALALDSGDERGTWHQWVNLLFGDQPALLDPQNREQDQAQIEQMPRPALLQIRSARLDAAFRQALGARPALKPAIAFMKPGVAIDPKTGSAQPDCFRIEELVRMDAVLTANHCALDFSEVPLTEDQQKAAYALVVAGAKLVERLGGKRRRGNGRCQIEVDHQPIAWLEWLQAHHTEIGHPPAWTSPELNPINAHASAQNAAWWAIPLTLTTLSPVVIPARTVGNVVQTLDFIPGRYLLRYLHKTLGRHIKVSQAIASGDLVITNATIAISDTAGRPTPLCIFSQKSSGGLSQGQGICNRFVEPEPDGVQIKSERGGYVGPTNGAELPAYKTVSLELFTHNTIQDRVQRPTREVGGIYSYQAIPAGTTLRAELRLSGALKEQLDQTSSDWWQALNGQVSIGQSKKDQYGVVQISAQPPVSPTIESVPGKLLYVWCLSDVLLRGDSLAPTLLPRDFKSALAAELGVELAERPEEDYLSVMMRSQRTESWQVRWGLPRPSMLGFQAGSCAVYEIQGDLPTPEKLAEIEARGIGDRRAEGYGQLCFNDPLLMTALVGKTRQVPTSPQPGTSFTPIARGHSSFEYARLIERAAWREMIQQKAFAIAVDDATRERILGIKTTVEDNQPQSHPPMSQLGSLRSVVSRLQEQNAQNPVTQWLTALKSVDNREAKWPEGSLDAVQQLVTDVDLVWTYLEFDQPAVDNLIIVDSLTITANGAQELRAALWAEAVRTLIDTIMRAHKRHLEDLERRYLPIPR